MIQRFSILAFCGMMGLAACSDGGGDPAVSEAAAPVVLSESHDRSEAVIVESARSRAPRTPKPGVLTAGDIDDGLNRAQFRRYLNEARKRSNLPIADFRNPLALEFVSEYDQTRQPGVFFTLRAAGADTPFWSGYSGVDGRSVIYPGLLGAGGAKNIELRAFANDQTQALVTTLKRGGNWQRIGIKDSGWNPHFLDLAFVVDATGSMGDELEWLQRDLLKLVNVARRAAPDVDIRFALIMYRDQGDAYVVRNYGFTKRSAQMKRWLRAQHAAGGGDYPEAAADAMLAASQLNWRRGQGERLLFHIADAPPHSHQANTYLNAARTLAQKDVQIFGLGASGVAAESELLMRQAAAMNNGRYLFLSDDSGVGNAHAEPTISCYRVSALTDLVTRVLQSELSGHRVEAREADIIREVGRYRNGVCKE